MASKRITPLLIAALAVCVAASAATAEAREVAGRLVGVADGDTITLLDRDKHQHKIRLDGIDAPE